MSFENQGVGEQVVSSDKSHSVREESGQKGLLAQQHKVAVSELPELPDVDENLEDERGELKEGGLTFSEMLESSQQGTLFQEGEVVEGHVVTVDSDYVTIDIGYKSEGQVTSSEFFDNPQSDRTKLFLSQILSH